MSWPGKPSAPPAPSSYQQSSWSQSPNPPPSSYQQSSWSQSQPPPQSYGQHPMNPHGYPQTSPQQPPGAYSYPPPYGSPYQPPLFPLGTDPEIIRCFQMADVDGSGYVDDRELQRVLSSANHGFSLRTIHLLMNLFANNTQRIGPKEFAVLWKCITEWQVIFVRFDRDRSGKIDCLELRDALLSLGYAVSPSILQILVSKFDSTGQARAIDYDNFIECGIIVKGLTDMFKAKDASYTGSATLSYETFMLMVLPYIAA